MNKLSEFLPFLIMIVVGIISVVRKTKRQPAEESALPEEVFPTHPPLIFDNSIPEKKIVTPVAPRISVPEKKQQVMYEQPVEIQDSDESEGFSIDLSDPEEVKRAIIYSEIFNKKDF